MPPARLRKSPAEAGLVETWCRLAGPHAPLNETQQKRGIGPANPQDNGERRDWFLRRKSDSGVWGGSAPVTLPWRYHWGIAGLPALMKCR